jgi:hypothetical protein
VRVLHLPTAQFRNSPFILTSRLSHGSARRLR